MPDVLDGSVAAAIRREPLNTSELIEGRGRGIDIDRAAARHGGLNRGYLADNPQTSDTR
jgi:hypothetical protein